MPLAARSGDMRRGDDGNDVVYAKIRQINAGRLDVDLEAQNVMDLGKNECAASAAQN